MAQKLLSKITFKAVVGKVKTEIVEIVDAVTKEVSKKAVAIPADLMRVYGVVTKFGVVSTNFGDSIRFIGDFRAINLETGETFSGGELFLPNTAETFVHNFIKGLGDDFQSLELAFDIGVKPANNVVGYEYTVAPLIERDPEADPLSRLFNSLPPMPKQLAAPEHHEKAKKAKAE